MERRNNKKYVAPLLGILLPIVSTNICRILGIWESIWGFLILAILYITAGAYFWEGTFKSSLNISLLVWLFIPIGVLIDVYIDFIVWKFDRNLFPIEIGLLWLIVPLFLFSGMWIRKILLKE